MKTIQLNKSSLLLPDCWEDLSYRERIFTFRVMSEMFAGLLSPEIARLKMLIEYTGYRPSWKLIISEALKKDSLQREIINLNLLNLSEELTFAFTIKENKIIPNHVFKKNPVSYIQIGRNRYEGRRFEIDINCRTNITAREFSDCFDLLSFMQSTKSEADRYVTVNQICAILFPENADYHANQISGHYWQMDKVDPAIKFGIVFWFTGIVKFYIEHPVYGLLFGSEKKHDDSGEKISLGMNEITLALQQAGYGSPESMNLNDFFDAQVKHLKDVIGKALAEGLSIAKIAEKTGIPLSTIQKLS